MPPYVPTISSIDDTSNFDEFESESSGPRIEDFMKGKEGFNGKNLPFIGFSFTRQLNAGLFSDGYVAFAVSHAVNVKSFIDLLSIFLLIFHILQFSIDLLKIYN